MSLENVKQGGNTLKVVKACSILLAWVLCFFKTSWQTVKTTLLWLLQGNESLF